MRPLLILLGFLCIYSEAYSQRRFIRTNSDAGFGSAIRVVPTNEEGWIIASMDSMRIAKYDKCGKKIWSKKYFIPNEHTSLTDIIALRSGGILVLTRKLVGATSACVLTRLDSAGNFVWCKSYEDAYYDQYGYSIDEDAFGNLLMYANAGHVGIMGYNMICKLSGNGTVLWTKFYDHGGTYGGGIITSDNGMLIRTGDIFIKTDPNGNIEWTAAAGSAGTYHYTTPVEVSDGYIYTKYKTTSRQIVFYKLNRLGILVPGSARVANYTGENPRLKITPAGNIAGIFNVGNYPTIVELDKNLNVLLQGSVDYGVASLAAKDFCFSGNEAIIAGVTGGSLMFFAKLDDLYKSSCDITLPLMNLLTDSANQNIYATTEFAYSLTEVTHNFSSVNISDEVITVCTVPLELELGPDVTICNFSSHLLRNNLLGLFNEYKWSTGETSPYIQIESPGKYWVEAIQYCEDSIISDTINIAVDSVPVPDWNSAITECENSPVVLYAPFCSQCTFNWSNGSSGDSLIVTESGTYNLVVENISRCSSNSSVDVEFAKCECEFYIPNTFTPNSDGINEVFRPVFYCEMDNYEMKIFNRFGMVVFSSNNPEEGWNGYFKNSKGI